MWRTYGSATARAMAASANLRMVLPRPVMFTCRSRVGQQSPPTRLEGRGHKIQYRNRNLPRSAAEEPRPARVDYAILRRLCPARQGSQEIAHLPPNAAAVLQATRAKHENVDRGCLGRIVGIPGALIA